MLDPVVVETFRTFKERVFGNEYMIWHDGLDVSAVTRLVGEARAEALAMLRLGVSIGDAHAAQALAAMGDDSARAAILAELESADEGSRVRLALAAHQLAKDPALAAELVRVLTGRGGWSVRIDAAIGLRHFDGADDETALLDSVAKDPDYLVRYHASESLLARWRVSPLDITAHPEVFARICGPREGAPGSADFARYAEARAALIGLRSTFVASRPGAHDDRAR